MIIVIDNYDSFTYNLVQYMAEVADESMLVRVVRNDACTAAEICSLKPSHVVISPGPCTPNEAGISVELIQSSRGAFPILGVCLGHQAIGAAFGAQVIRAKTPVHGKFSEIYHNGEGIFSDLPSPFKAGRYHSLLVEEASVPACLEVMAWAREPGAGGTEERIVMGLRHREYPQTIGVQFHPESILTEVGKKLLSAFLSLRVLEREVVN